MGVVDRHVRSSLPDVKKDRDQRMTSQTEKGTDFSCAPRARSRFHHSQSVESRHGAASGASRIRGARDNEHGLRVFDRPARWIVEPAGDPGPRGRDCRRDRSARERRPRERFRRRARSGAETIRLAAAAGLVGGSIEDATRRDDQPIYDRKHAAERVRAAVEAARALPFTFTLTARAENYLHGRPDIKDTIERLQAFQEAGADVLYAPGWPPRTTSSPS